MPYKDSVASFFYLNLLEISDEQKMTSLTPHEKSLKVYSVFLIPWYMLILVFWSLIFPKHIPQLLTLSVSKVQMYGSHEILRKFKEPIFVHINVEDCLNYLYFDFVFWGFFFNFVRGGGRERLFITRKYNFYDLYAWHFILASVCYLYFRVFLTFTVCSNNANLSCANTYSYDK